MSDPIDTKIVSRLAAILKMNDLAELEYDCICSMRTG